jgi:hypothetical protein
MRTKDRKRLKLAELIDLEIQLSKDRDQDPVEIRRRDREIGRSLSILDQQPESVFKEWLQRVQPQREKTAGQMAETGYRWLLILFLLMGVIFGFSTTRAVLDYDGSTPINVVNVWAIVIVPQWIFLFFFVLNMLPQGVRKWIPGIGEIYSSIREFGFWLARLGAREVEQISSGKKVTLWQELNRFRQSKKLYRNLERWLIVSITQRFGVAFNVTAILTLLYLVTFSDLAFAWNTTLQITVGTFHDVVQALAWPWHALFPQAVPSLHVIEASRYFRITSEYLGAPSGGRVTDAFIVGAWWPFLLCSVVVYGLLIRLFILSLSHTMVTLALGRLPYSSAYNALFDRLSRPLVETQAPGSEEPVPVTKAKTISRSLHFADYTKAHVITWGDLVIDREDLSTWVHRRFGWQTLASAAAGGLDYAENENVLQKLGQKDGCPVLVLVESWEVPDKSLLTFLRTLREQKKEQTPMVIGLVNTENGNLYDPPKSDHRQAWIHAIDRLEDPYIGIESMVEKS